MVSRVTPLGAPPERTRPSTSASFSHGVSRGTISVSTPRYFSTRHSRWVHWPPLSTTRMRTIARQCGRPRLNMPRRSRQPHARFPPSPEHGHEPEAVGLDGHAVPLPGRDGPRLRRPRAGAHGGDRAGGGGARRALAPRAAGRAPAPRPRRGAEAPLGPAGAPLSRGAWRLLRRAPPP